MRIRKLGVQGVLHFDDYELDLGSGDASFHVIYGLNEAGKSTLLQILTDLLFGGKIEDRFKDVYTSHSIIEGILEGSAGQSFHARRKKRYSRLTLTDGVAPELSESLLYPYLGGFSREQFTQLFGFDHDRLRQGGDSLLASGGHAGVSLFEAGGGVQMLQNLLSTLANRTDGLLDASFRSNSKKPLNVAWKAYQEAIVESRKSSLRSDDWRRLQAEIAAEERARDELRMEAAKLSAEVARLERIRRVRGLIVERSDLRSRLEELGDAPPPSPELAERIPGILDELRQNEEELAGQEREQDEQRVELEGLAVDPVILGEAAEVTRLYAQLERYAEALWEIPQYGTKIMQAQSQATELQKELAPDCALKDVETLRIPYAQREWIARLREALNEALRDAREADLRCDELSEEKAKMESDLAALGDSSDLSGFRRQFHEARQEGDLDELIRKMAAEIDDGKRLVQKTWAGQSVWTRDAKDAINLPIPLRETLDRFVRLWNDRQNDAEQGKRDRAQAEADLAALDDQVRTFELSGRVPVEAELSDARERRNRGWELVKQAWLDGRQDAYDFSAYAGDRPLHAAFEEAMTTADDIADWMRRESDRSALRAQLLLQREQLQQKMERVQNRIQNIDQEFSGLNEEWEREWDPCGIRPKAPAEMKEWVADYHRVLVEQLSKIDTLRREQGELVSRREFHARLLRAALSQMGRPTNEGESAGGGEQDERSLRQLLEQGEEIIRLEDGKGHKRAGLEQQLSDLTHKLRDQERRRAASADQVARLQTEWGQVRGVYPFLPEDATIAVHYLERLENLFEAVGGIGRLEGERSERGEMVTAFERQAEGLAERAGIEIPHPASYVDWVNAQYTRLEKAKKNDAQMETIQKSLARIEVNRKQRALKIDSLRTELNGHLAKYGCADAEALRGVVERSLKWKSLRDQLAAAEERLRQTGDGLPLPQLEAEVEQVRDADRMELRIGELNLEIADMNERLEALTKRLWERKREFAALDGSSTRAADAAQLAEAQLAEVDRLWGEYVRKELARQLLRRAIEQFREQNETVVLRRASEFFARLTLGHYALLAVEYEGGDPFLEAVRADGVRCRVAQLSDGARDQLFLALRLAFVDQHLASAEPLPLIMDDILVHFDDDRTEATLGVLNELAGKTQILYFTHHRHVADAAPRLARASRVEIHNLGALVAP